MLGQQVQLIGQQTQVIGDRICDAQREIPAQPGAADFEGSLQAAGDGTAGPRTQQQSHQRGDDCHQHDVKPPGLGEHRLARDQGHSTQGYPLSDKDRCQAHRRVGEH